MLHLRNPPINPDLLARDKPGAHQPHHGIRDILAIPDPTDRMMAMPSRLYARGPPRLLRVLVAEPALVVDAGEPGEDGVAPDPPLRAGNRHGLGQAQRAGFGGRVALAVGLGLQSAEGGDVDDAAGLQGGVREVAAQGLGERGGCEEGFGAEDGVRDAAVWVLLLRMRGRTDAVVAGGLRLHKRDASLADQERRREVHGKVGRPLFLNSRVFHGAAGLPLRFAQPRVVDEHVDFAAGEEERRGVNGGCYGGGGAQVDDVVAY